MTQLQTESDPLPWGTDHDIGSNLTIYIALGDPTPAQPLYELLLLAKEQVRDCAALFGPTTVVPHHKANPDLTQTTHAGLKYFIEPSRVFSPSHSDLVWGEFEVLTFWLYKYLWILLNHRECNFVLFRRYVTTFQQVNLGFGAIKPLETAVAVNTTLSGTARLPAESLSQISVDTS